MSKDIKELIDRYKDVNRELVELKREILEQIKFNEVSIPPRFNFYKYIENNKLFCNISTKADYVGTYELFYISLSMEEVIEIVRNGITIDYDYIKEHHK